MTAVLVAEDQVLVRAGLAALIRADPGLEVAGEAADGGEALLLAQAVRPDVVLMDVRMPGMSGIAATREIISALGPDAPRILILTTFDLDEYVYDAVLAGASGFLLKDTPPERLLAAIHTLAGGDVLLVPAALRQLVESCCRPAVSVARFEGLTARETEVLTLVARMLSNREIADRLSVAEATVKTHLNRTMAKLGLSSRAQAVAFAYEHGLVRPGRAARPSTQP